MWDAGTLTQVAPVGPCMDAPDGESPHIGLLPLPCDSEEADWLMKMDTVVRSCSML